MTDQDLHTIRTKDGRLLEVRPLRPEDAPLLVDLFDHMSPESRLLRFNLALTTPDPDLVWSQARRLAQVDPLRDGAWLVFADLPGEPDAPVAGARYVRLSVDTAEASLAVRDDMQNKGIGNQLLRFLVDQALAAGISKLVATIQRGNRPLWHLLKKSGFPIAFEPEGGYTTITVTIAEPEEIE